MKLLVEVGPVFLRLGLKQAGLNLATFIIQIQACLRPVPSRPVPSRSEKDHIMALHTLPVSFATIKYLGTGPKLDQDGDQQRDRTTNVLKWSVDVQAQLQDPRTGYPVLENIKVTVIAPEAPGVGIPQLADVSLEGLQAGAFVRGQNADFYFSATSVAHARQQKS